MREVSLTDSNGAVWTTEVATTRRERMRGLLGRDSLEDHRALLLPGARSVHTFGMRFPITAVFLDAELRVLEVKRIPPRRIAHPRLRARGVLECPDGTRLIAGSVLDATVDPRKEEPMSDLLNRDRLIFSQKAKLIELNQEFAIRDEEGNQIGTIRQEGQSSLKKFARLVSSLDQFMTHTLAVYDTAGAKVVELTRPRKVLKSTVLVNDGGGAEVGKIVQQNMVGKIRFALEDTQGQALGSINAENWRAWNFSIQDPAGTEVGRITKKWEGLAKAAFTTADNYILEVSGQVTPAMRQLMLASAAGVDLALKQDSRGLG